MARFIGELVFEYTGYTDTGGRPIYKLLQPLTYESKNNKHITIPAGFYTDLASIPKWIYWLFKPFGPWAKAAVLHDYLYYKYPDWSRSLKDWLFFEAMVASKVNIFIAMFFYICVRIIQELYAIGVNFNY